MLMPGSMQRGVTLIELVIGLAIVSILIAAGLPTFTLWIQNTQVRTAADSLQNGLQLARAEAVRRNSLVRFQLTTSLTGACAISTVGANWVVSQDDVTAACGNAASDTAVPRIIRVGSTAEGARNAAVASSEAGPTPVYAGFLIFNGWGRVVTDSPALTANSTLHAGNNLRINVTNPTAGTCADAGGTVRCLRLIVSSAGEIKLCDPALPAGVSGACP